MGAREKRSSYTTATTFAFSCMYSMCGTWGTCSAPPVSILFIRTRNKELVNSQILAHLLIVVLSVGMCFWKAAPWTYSLILWRRLPSCSIFVRATRALMCWGRSSVMFRVVHTRTIPGMRITRGRTSIDKTWIAASSEPENIKRPWLVTTASQVSVQAAIVRLPKL